MVLIFANITQGLPDHRVRPAFTSVAEMPLFFGTAIFAFEGISLVSGLRLLIFHSGVWSVLIFHSGVWSVLIFHWCLVSADLPIWCLVSADLVSGQC